MNVLDRLRESRRRLKVKLEEARAGIKKELETVIDGSEEEETRGKS